MIRSLFISFIILCNSIALLCQTIPINHNQTDSDSLRQGSWTILFDAEWEITNHLNKAEFYRIINYADSKPQGIVRDYYRDGTVQWEGKLLADQPEDVIDGTCFYYHADGSLQFEAVYDNGSALGQLEYENDVPKVGSWKDVYAFGDVYWNRKEHSEAARCYRLALPIAEREEGKGSGYANLLNDIALCEVKIKQFDAALINYKAALNILEREKGIESDWYNKTVQNMGLVHFKQGDLYWNEKDYKTALIFYFKAKAIFEEFGATFNPKYANLINDIGVCLDKEKEYDSAIAYINNALALKAKFYSVEDKEYKSTLYNLGLFLSNKSRALAEKQKYDSSILLQHRALKAILPLHGKYHSTYSEITNSMGVDYSYIQQPDSAEYYYRESLAIRDSIDGKQSKRYAQALRNIALLYHQEFKYQQAISLFEIVLETFYQVLEPNNELIRATHKNIGEAYFRLAQYSMAEEHYREALEFAEKHSGISSLNYAYSCNNMAITLEQLVRYEEALPLMLKAKQLVSDSLGDKDEHYATNCYNLGSLYYSMGQFNKAEPLYLQAREIYQIKYGLDHLEYIDAVNHLGRFYLDIGKFSLADSLFQEIDTYWQRQENKFHPKYGSFLMDYALLKHKSGNYNEAEKLTLSAITIRKQFYSTTHPAYLRGLDYLASIYEKQGKYTEAEKLFNDNLTTSFKIGGETHPVYMSTLNNLGKLYLGLGKYGLADSLLQRAKKTYVEVYGEFSKNYATTLNNLAILKDYLGETEACEDYYLKVIEIEEQLYEEGAPSLARSYNNIGSYYLDLGNLAKAEAYINKALQIRVNTLDEMHPLLMNSYGTMADLQNVIGNYEEAEQFHLKVLEMAKETYGETHPDFSYSLNNLAMFYDNMGRFDEAEQMLRKALNIRIKAFGYNNPVTITTMDNLGGTYMAQGKNALAVYYIARSEKLSASVNGIWHRNYALNVNNLGYAYRKQKRYSDALEKYQTSNEVLRKIDNPFDPYFSSSYLNVALVNQKLGNTKEAAANFISMTQLVATQIENNFTNLSEKEKTGYYSTIKNKFNFQTDFAYHQQEQLPEFSATIFNTQLMTKGLLFRSTNKVRDNILNSGDSVLIDRYYNWKGQKDYLAKVYGMDESERKEQELSVEELEQGINDLEKELVSRSSFFEGMSEQTNATWENVRDALNPGEAAVEIIRFRREEEKVEYGYFGKGVSINTIPNDAPRFSEVVRNSPAYRAGLRPNEALLKINNKLTKSLSEEELYNEFFKEGSATYEFKSFSNDSIHTVTIMPDSVFQEVVSYHTTYAALIVRAETTDYPEMVFLENGEELETKWVKYYSTAIKHKLKDENSYAQFWQPIADKLIGVKKAYVSTDGIYHSVSLNTFLNPSTGNYLGQELDIQLVGNLSEVLNIGAKKEAIQLAVLVGYPDYNNTTITNTQLPELQTAMVIDTTAQRFFNGEEITMLPGTKKEVNNLKTILEKAKIEVQSYLDNDASEALVKSLKSPSVLHLATHGFFLDNIKQETEGNERGLMGMDIETVSTNSLLRSGLLFSNAKQAFSEGGDGILTAYEAMNLNLDNTEMVVLSACETGLGEVKNGEGVYGLQRAMQAAGAKTVLMSLWTVSDEATQMLMTNFYKNWLLKKQNKRTAFRNARSSLREKFPEPFYWGAFVMVGE